MDNCTEITINLQNKLSYIPIYSGMFYSCNPWFYKLLSSITLMSYICSVCYKCTYYCAFIMVCVWPLSPSSYEVSDVAIAITNWVVGDTSIVVTYLIDFVWANICCICCSIEISFEACFSNCVTIYSSTTSFVVFPPFNSTSGLDWTS